MHPKRIRFVNLSVEHLNLKLDEAINKPPRQKNSAEATLKAVAELRHDDETVTAR